MNKEKKLYGKNTVNKKKFYHKNNIYSDMKIIIFNIIHYIKT